MYVHININLYMYDIYICIINISEHEKPIFKFLMEINLMECKKYLVIKLSSPVSLTLLKAYI